MPVVACALHSQVALRGRRLPPRPPGRTPGLRDDRLRGPAGRPVRSGRRPAGGRAAGGDGDLRPGLRRRLRGGDPGLRAPGGGRPGRARPQSSWGPGPASSAPTAGSASAGWRWPPSSTWRPGLAAGRSWPCASPTPTPGPATRASATTRRRRSRWPVTGRRWRSRRGSRCPRASRVSLQWNCQPTSTSHGVTSMGRSPEDDPRFFRYAAAAGVLAAQLLETSP